ncbi:MAG: c-type cytochrome [bacterium]|nr:c-type cytochrome [bacterium]
MQRTRNTQLAAFWAIPTIVAGAALLATSRSVAEGPGSGDDGRTNREHLSPIAWSSKQWRAACGGLRTSYNPDHDLSDTELTLVPGDERWVDFVYWTLNNKIAEHQVEEYGGTEWDGPTGGVVFHWAPGSHWERDTLASFGFTIGHTIGEHRWMDTMFPDFFEKYGGVYGINVKDRITEIDPDSPTVWVEFLQHIGGATSPYYRYLFHQEVLVDPTLQEVHLIGGQGVAFTYSFERYYHELREVLTDCRAADFFRMYDMYGHGFAADGDWAHQGPADYSLSGAGYHDALGEPRERYDPNPPPVDVPADLREAEAMRRGKDIYLAQCAVCHGIQGEGSGFLAEGFDVPPRDFTRGVYAFRSTVDRERPKIEDIERVVRAGVPGTTMPAWGQFLSDEQIADVSRYLVVFSESFTEDWRAEAEPELLVIPAQPADMAALVERGKGIAEKLNCASCHGTSGRGDGPSAPTLKNDWEQHVSPGDWTYKWSFRGGYEAENIYRSVWGTLTGSGMPEFADAVPDETDRWAVVAYVMSFCTGERPALRLVDYPDERQTRIGANGRVLPREQ